MAITSYLYQILIFLKKKEEEFQLPTQHIYSKTSLSSKEQERWDANKK